MCPFTTYISITSSRQLRFELLPVDAPEAVSMLLKTSIVIRRWVDRVADLRSMKKTTKPKHVETIDKQLEFDDLILIPTNLYI